MDQKYISQLNELMIKYKNIDYLDGYHSMLVSYYLKKEKLTITLHTHGEPKTNIKLIQDVISNLYDILPIDFKYYVTLNGWSSEVINGNFNLDFIDQNYYIKPENQEMHERKEIVTILEVADFNNISYTEFKWNLLKKKSIELGFTPVKNKGGLENLYLTVAFKQCYPELDYSFTMKNEQTNETIEIKKKKWFGLF